MARIIKWDLALLVFAGLLGDAAVLQETKKPSPPKVEEDDSADDSSDDSSAPTVALGLAKQPAMLNGAPPPLTSGAAVLPPPMASGVVPTAPVATVLPHPAGGVVTVATPGASTPVAAAPAPMPAVQVVVPGANTIPPPPPESPWTHYMNEIEEEIDGVHHALDDTDLTGTEFQQELDQIAAETTPTMSKMFHLVLEKEKIMKDVLVDPILHKREVQLHQELMHAKEMVHREQLAETVPPPQATVPMPMPPLAMTEGKEPEGPTNKPTVGIILIGAAIAVIVFGAAFYVMKK